MQQDDGSFRNLLHSLGEASKVKSDRLRVIVRVVFGSAAKVGKDGLVIGYMTQSAY